jgi:hypothetical protein
MNVSSDLLRFGEIHQRPSQNMIIAGVNKKFITSFNLEEDTPIGLTEGLRRTINYYKKLA